MWRSWLLALSAFCTAVAYVIVIPDGIPSFERDEFNYIVALASSESTDDSLVSEEPSERVLMTSSDGVTYSCAIPSRHEADHTSLEDFAEITEHNSPFKYLQPMKHACLSRLERWWKYEFCFDRHIRQYHEEEGKSKMDFLLGSVDPSHKLEDEIREDFSGGKTIKYVRQIFTNGDVCRETNEKRTTEVRFVCEEHSQLKDPALMAINEAPTCHYVATVHAPLLCNHPEFRTHETTRVIVCDRVAQTNDPSSEEGEISHEETDGQTLSDDKDLTVEIKEEL